MQTIAVDFDGTLAKEGAGIEPGTGEPLPGAIEFLYLLDQNDFSIIIFSLSDKTRIQHWMNNYAPNISVHITNIKPSVLAYIDNRAIRFEGTYPTLEYLRSLK